jgi:RimJ/RimL family protein N-acetyltransferase
MNKSCYITLKTPSLADLSYRKQLLSNPETMEYNSGYDVSYYGYNYDTGCIDFNESKWNNWYSRQVKNSNKFYAYVYNNKTPVGEVFFSEEGSVSIIIEAKYRAKGYAKQALKLLIDKAFNEYGLKQLKDSIPENRIGAVKLFKDLGFTIKDTYEGTRFNKPEKILILELNRDGII